MQTESVEQNSSGTLGFLKATGFAIRDWLGPIYTLIGFVTLTIGFFALVDSTGVIVRAIAAALTLATLFAWCFHQIRKYRSKIDPQSPQLHHVLFTISLFFGVGLLINEFLLHGKRKALEAAFPTDSTPSENQSSQAPTPPVAATASTATTAASVATASTASPSPSPSPSPVASSPAVTSVAPAAAAVAPVLPNATAQRQTPTPAPEAARERPASTKAAPITTSARAERDDAAEHAPRTPTRTERAEARKPSSSGDAERCSSLIGKFSLGQNLSEADRHYLETSCR